MPIFNFALFFTLLRPRTSVLLFLISAANKSGAKISASAIIIIASGAMFSIFPDAYVVSVSLVAIAIAPNVIATPIEIRDVTISASA